MAPRRDSAGRFVSGGGSASAGLKVKVGKIEWNDPNVIKFLKTDPGIHADLERRSTAVRDAAGGLPHYRSAVEAGRDRQRAAVWTWTYEAMVSEAEEHNLLRALDAAR
jgi:hypothetical protein